MLAKTKNAPPQVQVDVHAVAIKIASAMKTMLVLFVILLIVHWLGGK
jgi:hypothetical protein